MARIESYRVIFYGGRDGYDDCRAQIELYSREWSGAGPPPPLAGRIKFHDPWMPLPYGTQFGGSGITTMHLRIAMLKKVIEMLRNEDSVYITQTGAGPYFALKEQPVGQAE